MDKIDRYKVYVIDIPMLNEDEDIVSTSSNEKFRAVSEKQNNVFSLEEFINMYNEDNINSATTFIRILKWGDNQ